VDNRTAVVAIGGNSLITDELHQSVADQYLAAQQTTKHIASMIEQGWNVVVSHGGGPQVGFILRRSELAAHEIHEVPLDVILADMQGSIGYVVAQNLQNELLYRGIKKDVVCVITQSEVDADDPAFKRPTKPIGSFMDRKEAIRRRDQDGWDIMEDANRGYRRIIASPRPARIVELNSIKLLVEGGVVVIAVGGGGIPVVADGSGQLKGVPVVLDKDLGASLLARNLGVDYFLITTAVEKVALNFGKRNQQWVDHLTLAEARGYLEGGTHFATGSMAPKIQAVVDFLAAGGIEAIITDPDNLERALAGETGTHITRT